MKASFTKLLDTAEDWLYSDEGYDADFKALKKQYSEVSKVGDPIEELFTESRARPEAIANAKKLIEQVKASAEEMLAAKHITQESADQAIKSGKTLAKWLSDSESKQAKLDKTDPVAVKSAEIDAKAAEYAQAARTLLRKKPIWYESEGDDWWTSVDLWAAVVLAVVVAVVYMPLAVYDRGGALCSTGARVLTMPQTRLGGCHIRWRERVDPYVLSNNTAQWLDRAIARHRSSTWGCMP